jgi:hypothetical protein
MCTLILGPISIGLAVGGGFGLGSGKPLGVVLGILAPALIISFIAYWTRTRRSLAKAMSLGLGETITPREIPRMTAEEFDAWRERRNRRATHA